MVCVPQPPYLPIHGFVIIVLDEVEKLKLVNCLDYCFHRLVKHPDCGLKDLVDIDFVEYMRKNL